MQSLRQATGKAFVDPVQIGDWKTVPEEKALYARATCTENSIWHMSQTSRIWWVSQPTQPVAGYETPLNLV